MDNKQLIQDFILESRDNLADIEPDLLELEKSLESPPQDLINDIFRGIHSIKGASGFFNFNKINSLSHIMESLLMKLRDGEMPASHELIDALFAGIDKLKMMIDDVENSDSYDIEDEIEQLSNQLPSEDEAEEAKPEQIADVPDEDNSAKSDGEAFDLSIIPDRESFEKSSKCGQSVYLITIEFAEGSIDSPESMVNETNSVGKVLRTNPEIDSIDAKSYTGKFAFTCSTVLEHDLIALALGVNEANIKKITINDVPDEEKAPVKGEDDIESTDMICQNELDAILSQISGVVDDDVVCIDNSVENKKVWGLDTIQSTENKKSNIVEEIKVAAKEPIPIKKEQEIMNKKTDLLEEIKSKGHSETKETIRVNVNLLDNLMNLVGELVLGRNQLMQILSTQISEFKGLNGVLQNINLITSELQESIMQTRMQPVGRVFDKFPRILRDLSRKLGKDIDLKIFGNDVELDRSIIEALSDPLTHLIRNTADHGIESPTERASNGKSTTGQVILRAYHEAGLVNIEIIDDGKGIDANRIREKAVEKRLISVEEAQAMSDKEVLKLIFAPGFSTAKEITDVSGRGVGMDVVKTNIEKLGGTVDLESTPGDGTRVNLRLPLTLAIISAMIIKSGGERFAIPQVNIEQVLRLREKDMEESIDIVNDSKILRYRENILPLVDLAEVLEIPKEARENKRTKTIMVLKALNNKFGLFVDKVIDSEETVVKPMSKYLKSNNCYAGSTIMGDGEVATILDAQGIAQTSQLDFEEIDERNKLTMQAVRSGHKELQSILIFSNSSSEKYAIQLDMIRRIEKISISQIEQIGNEEYIKYDGGSLKLVRLENYLNVNSSEIDKDHIYLIIPNITQKPVGIVAGEILDVMETAISLDPRNISSPGILGSSIIQEEIMLVLDIYGLLQMVDTEIFGSGICYEAVQSKKALLIEDTPFLRYLESFYLKDAGIEVVEASDGAEAMKRIAKERFDIVLSDIKLHDIDGNELSKFLKQSELNSTIPVLGLYSSEMDTRNTMDVGYSSFEKKTDKVKLLSTVCSLLKSSTEMKEAA